MWIQDHMFTVLNITIMARRFMPLSWMHSAYIYKMVIYIWYIILITELEMLVYSVCSWLQ